MSRLGAEAFDQLRLAHFAALRQALDRHGGEEVKNTGDGLMATFGSVVDAVRGAVAMQQATDRQARTGRAPIAIRVGVSIGEVTFEDGDVFGAPVVEAARLVAAAGPGKILTTSIARALAGGRADAEFGDLGPMELKGLPDPVPVCEVLWQSAAWSIPMPALLTDIGRVFVGRDDELERLRQLWKEAVAGERRVALIAGEPGVGKTRVAAELAEPAHGEGALVLAGRCDEDLGVPYQPFVEALRHFINHTPEDLEGRLGAYGGELVRLVPEISPRVGGLGEPLRSDPETERYRLFDAVAAWLAAACEQSPLLLVLDDLQWAAKPTLLLLRHVVRFPELKRLLILGTYRDTELGHDHPLVELQFAGDSRRIDLGREALAMARRLGDEPTLAETLAGLWLAMWDPATLAERSGLAAELFDLAGRLGDRNLEFNAGMSVFLNASEAGDMDRADVGLAACVRVADELGQPVLRWRATFLRGHRAFAAGRFDEVERLTEETLRLGIATGQPDSLGHSNGPRSVLRILQGRPEEAVELLVRTIEQLPGAVVYPAALAWAYAELGRNDAAAAGIAALRGTGFAGLPRVYTWLCTLSLLSRACARLGDAGAAGELFDLLVPHRRSMVVVQTGWLGPVAHDLGLLADTLARHGEADEHFAAAEEVQDRIGARGTLIHTRLEWARALLRRRPANVERASALLDGAAGGARELCLPAMEARIAAVRAEAG
jgi:hypothetical protein